METPHNGLAYRRERCLLSLSLFSICCCGAAPGLNPSTSLRSCSSRSLSPRLLSLSFFSFFIPHRTACMAVGPVALAAVVCCVGSFWACTSCDAALLSFRGLRAPTASTAWGRLSRMLCAVVCSGGVRRQHPWRTAAVGSAGSYCRPLLQVAYLQRCQWWQVAHCTHVRLLNSATLLPFAGTPQSVATTVRLGPWPHPLRSSDARYASESDIGLLMCDAEYIAMACHWLRCTVCRAPLRVAHRLVSCG